MTKYTPRVVLVTGGAGFIGSHFVLMLVRKYPHYHIINVDKLDYCSSLRTLQPIKSAPNYEFVRGNITSLDLVMFLLRDRKVDTVVHFAAQSHVDLSFDSSLEFTSDNVLGTTILLHAARMCGVERFIHVSTDEVYGTNVDGLPVTEENILAPTNPYAGTKAAAELIANSYYRSFRTPVIITRSNNVYGPHQFPDKVIPKFICQLLRGNPCWIHGDGMNSRHYLYVDDVVDAYDRIMHEGTVGETYNIGTDFEIRNIDLAKYLMRQLGIEGADEQAALIEHVVDRSFNDSRYIIDSSKMHALGWAPQILFAEGIGRTIAWYREHCSRTWDMIEPALQPHPRKLPPCTQP